MRRPQRTTWWLCVALIGLVLAASATSLRNGFAYDDIPIIRTNPRAHSLVDAGIFFVTGYWPRESGGALYRPLTLVGYAAQWMAGGGSPLPFHLMNVLAYAALTLLVFALARTVLNEGRAWIAAALFAVHPVHVEAVGNVVGQAEVTTAILVCLATLIYLRARRIQVIRARDSIALFLLTIAAGLTKENGILLPALLVVAELTIVSDPRPLRTRLREVGSTAALLAVAVGIVLGCRFGALGTLLGEHPALALRGLGFGERATTMLGLAPEWFRLLFWPAHLQADYSPPGTDAALTMGPRQFLGLALISGALMLAAACRRRRPAVTFGILWAAVAIGPVSNLLTPTGLLVGERTLMLASVGVMIALGAAIGELFDTMPTTAPKARALALAGIAAVLLAGVIRSAQRQLVWRDNSSLIRATVADAPRSYRAWRYYGDLLRDEGRYEEAKAALDRSVALYDKDASTYESLAQLAYVRSGCAAAIPYLDRALGIFPEAEKPRLRLHACLLTLNDSARANAVAAEGAKLGQWYFQLRLAQEEQARRIAAQSN
ncbi:MAG TPA: glycosyltransferase family 39 protein [Gemmatimonadales bacterium]|nr:glycosyltransferase family 39 protein [Gemmatimonadales bacterium]